MKKTIVFNIAAVLLLGTQHSFAAGYATASPPLQYQVTLVKSCVSAVVSGLLDFGTHGTLDADLINAPAGTVTVTCSNGGMFKICIDGGLHPNHVQSNMRHMGNVTETAHIGYVLKDSSNGQQVGDLGCSAYDGMAGYTETATWANPADITGGGAGGAVFQLSADVYISMANDTIGVYDDALAVNVVW